MAQILADEGEADGCRISTAIGMLKTVGSVVFRPQDGAFWIATGEVPTSQGRYIPFDLNTEDYAPQHGTLDTGRPADGPAPRAFEYYRDAYLDFFDGKDLDGSRTKLSAAIELQPREPLYLFIDGLLKMKAREFQAAKISFDTCLHLGHPHEERIATFHLWRGRALELSGHRKEALLDYRAILELEADPLVRKAAQRGLKRKYKARKASRIDVDFTFADVVEP
jgi:tetratricopeptide (TPR) repeat protein